jgi:hypothetical protein
MLKYFRYCNDNINMKCQLTSKAKLFTRFWAKRASILASCQSMPIVCCRKEDKVTFDFFEFDLMKLCLKLQIVESKSDFHRCIKDQSLRINRKIVDKFKLVTPMDITRPFGYILIQKGKNLAKFGIIYLKESDEINNFEELEID